jgi:hypothetical protein
MSQSYYEKNKEKILERNRMNKEKISIYFKKYYEKNKEKILRNNRINKYKYNRKTTKNKYEDMEINMTIDYVIKFD